MTAFGGDIIYAADINEVYNASVAKPLVRLVQTVLQNFAHNTATAITFTTEVIDTHGFHDNVTNNSRVTPNVPGYYRATGRVVWGSDNDWTIIEARIARNGTVLAAIDRNLNPGTASSVGRATIATAIVECNGSTDYIQLLGLHANTNTGTNDTGVTGAYSSMLEVEFLRGL